MSEAKHDRNTPKSLDTKQKRFVDHLIHKFGDNHKKVKRSDLKNAAIAFLETAAAPAWITRNTKCRLTGEGNRGLYDLSVLAKLPVVDPVKQEKEKKAPKKTAAPKKEPAAKKTPAPKKKAAASKKEPAAKKTPAPKKKAAVASATTPKPDPKDDEKSLDELESVVDDADEMDDMSMSGDDDEGDD